MRDLRQIVIPPLPKPWKTPISQISFGDLSEADTAKLHYLRAQSLEGLDRREEAVLSYQYVVEEHGNSAYAGLIHYRTAVQPREKSMIVIYSFKMLLGDLCATAGLLRAFMGVLASFMLSTVLRVSP